MKTRIRLFLVDDDRDFRELIVDTMPKDKYDLEVFESGTTLLKALEEQTFDVGLVDVKMPDIDGIALLREMKRQNIRTEIIVMTGQASIDTAIESMKLGSYDYLAKPVHLSELDIVIQKAYEKKLLSEKNVILREELALKERSSDLVGESGKMRDILSLINKVACTSSTVLVEGESGTGKELVAHAIHKHSSRNDKPFIVIDCANLSENLLENELFGHEKGAFTDATSQKLGLIEIADGGTLFIDEIGEMNTATQAKLLRMIETQQFRRLGGNRQITVDVRIIAATNRVLTDAVAAGRFRKDLYYRLNVISIHLPPLRERREDIPLLVAHFLAESRTGAGKRMSDEAMSALSEYEWPGNVRELANVIERALIISPDDLIMPEHLALVVRRPGSEHQQPSGHFSPVSALVCGSSCLKDELDRFEHYVLQGVLKECGGDKIKASRLLKISLSQFYRKLNKLEQDIQ